MPAVRADNIHDPRFVLLGKLLETNVYDAIGRMVFVWNYCTETQNHIVETDMLVAISSHENFPELVVKSGLGEVVEGGIRIKGTKGRIEWLATLRKNGRKGGRPKVTKPKPKNNQMVTQNETNIEPESNPITIAITSTITNKKKSIANTPEGGPLTTDSSEKENEKTETTQAWEHYVEKLQSDHDIKASRGAKEMSLVKKLVREFGLESTKNMINSFLDDTDRFVVDQAYQIGLLYSQRQKYSARGKEVVVKEAPSTDPFENWDGPYVFEPYWKKQTIECAQASTP